MVRKCGLEHFWVKEFWIEDVFSALFIWRCLLYLWVFTWKEHGRCYIVDVFGSSKQIFFDVIARIDYSFKLFLSIFNLKNVHFYSYD